MREVWCGGGRTRLCGQVSNFRKLASCLKKNMPEATAFMDEADMKLCVLNSRLPDGCKASTLMLELR